MTARRSGASVPVLATAAAAVLLGLTAAGCGPAPPPPAVTPVPAASSQGLAASPVVGLLTKLDVEGLVRVSGFRLRTDDGTELGFAMGGAENGLEFPPSHLAEHMATTSRVRVFFRHDAGARVVYRLEDAD